MAEFGPVVCGVGCGILGHFGHAGFVPGAELDFRAIVLRPDRFRGRRFDGQHQAGEKYLFTPGEEGLTHRLVSE